jgi:hypothetical protein
LNILTCIDGNFADADDSSAMTGIDAWKHLMLGATPIAEIDWGRWERKGPVLSYGPRVFWTSVEMVPAQEAEFFLSPTDATDFTHDLGHPVLVGLPENGRALRLRACERWSGGCLETKPVLSAMRIGASTLRGLPVFAWTDQATGSVRNGGVQISVGSFTDTLLGRAQALDGQRSHVGPGLVCGDDIGQGYDCVVAVADGDDPRAPIVIRRFNVNAASRDIDVDPVSYALPLNLGTASDLALWRYDGMLTIAFRSMLSHQWIYVFSIDAFDPVGEVKLTWIRDVDTADVGPNGFSENPGGSSGLSVVR